MDTWEGQVPRDAEIKTLPRKGDTVIMHWTGEGNESGLLVSSNLVPGDSSQDPSEAVVTEPLCLGSPHKSCAH